MNEYKIWASTNENTIFIIPAAYILQKIDIPTIGCRKIHVQNIYEKLRNGRLDRSNSFTSNKYLTDFVEKRTYNQRQKISKSFIRNSRRPKTLKQ